MLDTADSYRDAARLVLEVQGGRAPDDDQLPLHPGRWGVRLVGRRRLVSGSRLLSSISGSDARRCPWFGRMAEIPVDYLIEDPRVGRGAGPIRVRAHCRNFTSLL